MWRNALLVMLLGDKISESIRSGHYWVPKHKKLFWALVITAFITMTVLPFAVFLPMLNTNTNPKIICPYCGSKDTTGYHTYWYNDGMLCTGSDEYAKTHADYTFGSCNYCGKHWKINLK